MKKKFMLIICLLVFCSFINSISAFGISSTYGNENPLKIYQGGTEDIQFKLMTSLNEDNLILKVELIDNAGVASLTDLNNEYNVNVGEVALVNMRVRVNKTAKTGEEHIVILKISDITPTKKGGSVSFKGSSTINLNVLVVQPELKETKATGLLLIFGFFLLIGVIAIILIIWLIVKNRKNNF